MVAETVSRAQATRPKAPVKKDVALLVPGDATMNAAWYWPPLVGKAEACSARPQAETEKDTNS